MPRKNKKKSNLNVDSGSPTNKSEKAGMELAGVSSELEHFVDQQFESAIDALLSKYTNMTKSDIAEIKKSQDFLSEKFNNIVKSIDALKLKITIFVARIQLVNLKAR